MSICGGRGLKRALSCILLFMVTCANQYCRSRVDIVMNPGHEQIDTKEDKENAPLVRVHPDMTPVSPNLSVSSS